MFVQLPSGLTLNVDNIYTMGETVSKFGSQIGENYGWVNMGAGGTIQLDERDFKALMVDVGLSSVSRRERKAMNP